jgi:hypothetical protein
MTIAEKTQKELSQRAIYLVLDWSALGTWKRVDTEKVVTKKQKRDDEVRARKRIIDSNAMSELRSVRYGVKRMLRTYALNSMFRPGVYAIPIEHVDHVDSVLQDAATKMSGVREKLQKEWPAVIKNAKERLGDLFDPADYPSAEEASNEMQLNFRYMSIAETPAILKTIAADVYKEDLIRAKKETEKELEAFRLHLRAALLEIVETMRKTLQKPDGERKVFGQRFFKRLDEFMATFQVRDLSDDGELKKVVAKLKKVANGTDLATLKVDRPTQKALDKTLKGINTELDKLVEDGDSRMMDLSLAS